VAQQFGAKLQLLEARDRRLSVERDLQMARNKELELNREIASLEAEKTAFTKSWRQKTMEDLLSASRDRDGVNEQLQKADKRKKMVNLVSPIDAVVLEIAKLSEGSIVKEAEQMFTLVPLSSQLEAEVKIDSIDIGYIKNGDVAHLKLDAFPFQKHGALEANIRGRFSPRHRGHGRRHTNLLHQPCRLWRCPAAPPARQVQAPARHDCHGRNSGRKKICFVLFTVASHQGLERIHQGALS